MKFIPKLAFLIVGVFFVFTPKVFALETERVSISSSGAQGNLTSQHLPSLSADGRYVAFNSMANNLVSGDTNNSWDAFVYDRQANTIERVSVSNSGVQGNDHSFATHISADGRYVVIASYASNLVPNDTNTYEDTFVYDRQTDTIERVSVNNQGVEGNLSSAGGTISDNGQFVAFWSMSSNLVPGDTNSGADVFVYNRQTDTIERVSVNNAGIQGTNGNSDFPHISADGRYVAFTSNQIGLVSGDTNTNFTDAFIYDRQTDTIKRISENAQGVEANNYSVVTSMSANGRYVVMTSTASNLYAGDVANTDDIFVYDNVTQVLEKVISGTSSWAGLPSISDNGRFIAFLSDRSNLVAGDTNNAADAFIYDRQLLSTQRVSVNTFGNQASGVSGPYLMISGDASCVAFTSAASNLVAGDTNGVEDVFVRQLKRTIVDASVNREPSKPINPRPVIVEETKIKENQTATVIESVKTKEIPEEISKEKIEVSTKK